MVVDGVIANRDNNLDITLAIPIEGDGESVAIASQPSSGGGEDEGSRPAGRGLQRRPYRRAALPAESPAILPKTAPAMSPEPPG